MLIRSDRIIGAGFILPLTQHKVVDKSLGTRHRAAIGLLGYPAWDGNNIIVILSMSLILILLFLGITTFMNRSRQVFSFSKGQKSDAPGNEVATRLENRFRQKKDRDAIIILVILPFLFLNIIAILQHGTIFYGNNGTPTAILLDIINYGSGYAILYLFAIVISGSSM